METIIIHSIDEIAEAASQFLDLAGQHRVMAFTGDLGAGKTTFIKELCAKLGSTDNVSSPTFAIVNEYELIDNTGQSSPIFHMDLYRLKDREEALQAGCEEYITGDYYCFIEWPEIIQPLLPEDTLYTKIEVDPEKNQRKITIFN